MKIDLKNRPILRDLGGGLILCRSSAKDTEALAEFNSKIHSDWGIDKPDTRVSAWTRDLLSDKHPTFHPDDFTIVAEADGGRIVSSMNLISQTWAYEGIPFGVGRPELVGTLPEYRRKGLISVQFDEVHRWSAERGELVQGITGIPFYYRKFGYEMGLELSGGRVGFEAQLPVLKMGETEPYVFRLAEENDIPFLIEVYAHACRRRLITCLRDESIWRYELTGQDPLNVNRMEYRIIEEAGSHIPVGYITHPWYNWDTGLVSYAYEIKQGISWLAVTPSVARYLWQTGGGYKRWGVEDTPRTTYGFMFGSEHPSYDIFQDRLPRKRDPYSWYIRVADIPKFLRQIAPALEKHISDSAIVGYDGELKVGFYGSGIRMVFEHGKPVTIEPWKPLPGNMGEALFPDLSFLQLVFGHRNYEELYHAYTDCMFKDDETRVLLNTLFPKRPSSVMCVN